VNGEPDLLDILERKKRSNNPYF